MDNKTWLSKNQLVAFFLIAFGFSWFFWLFDVLDGMKVVTLPFSYFVLYTAGAHGPLVAALVMTGKLEGWTGIKALIKSGFQLRIPLR